MKTFLFLGAVFWGVNFVLRNILHIVTIPVKWLTFGLFSIVINLGMLYFFERVINSYYQDMASVQISPDYLKALILSMVITLAYSLLSKLLK
ncbi:MAG: phage holin family protein [bacterium]|nr:phage holin family protein [bacterium]